MSAQVSGHTSHDLPGPWALGGMRARTIAPFSCCVERAQHLAVSANLWRAPLPPFRFALMPPKGSKNKAVAAGVEPAARVDCKVEVKVELAAGESDKVNLAYIEKVQNATECVSAHQFFKQIEKELPLKITDTSDSGVQSPFDAAACRTALHTRSESYTCGVNLFWINLLWSPTPGVPLRCSASESMSATRFAQPCVMDVLHVAVPDKDYNPLEHKGPCYG